MIPLPWAKLGVLAAVAVVSGGAAWSVATWRGSAQIERVRTQLAEIKQQHAERVAQAEAAGRAAVESAMAAQVTKAQEVAENAQALLKDLDAAAARGAALDRRLRDAARATAARACGDPAHAVAPATGSASAPSAGGVLPDVLGGLVEAGRAMAEEADRRRIAGLACEAVSQ